MAGTRLLGESTVYRTRRFAVIEARMRMHDREITKPFIRHNDIVFVLPITEDGKIILIRSYRPEVRGYVLEVVSGTLKKNEKPEKGVRRELLEEAGVAASKLRHMFSGYPMLGYSDSRYHFFEARELERVGQKLEQDEDIKVLEMTKNQIFKLIAQNKIDDINLLLAMQCLSARKS